MEVRLKKPKKALNKSFLKVKPNRDEIEKFKTQHCVEVKEAQTDQLVFRLYGLKKEEIGL
jgi:hypothetical protein